MINLGVLNLKIMQLLEIKRIKIMIEIISKEVVQKSKYKYKTIMIIKI